MRRSFVVMLLLLSVFTTAGPNALGAITVRVEPTALLDGSFVPNEILVGLKPFAIDRAQIAQATLTGESGLSLGSTSLDLLNRQFDVQRIVPLFESVQVADADAQRNGLAGIYKLQVPEGTDIFAMLMSYRSDSAIEYAEVNRIYRATMLPHTYQWAATAPNDPGFNKQWGLHNTGQTGGRADADIDAPEAWAITTGAASVLIAVVDTGVDYNHADLKGSRMRTDIDRDFINKDEDAMDDQGHGTFVAGIIAASANNSVGIAGVCHSCQILPVKVLDSEGSGSAESVAQGIQYAGQAGARIISMSLGFSSDCGCSQTVARAINYSYERGSLLIAASGNDSDKKRISYPAASPRVMAVGASDHSDREANFSNRSNDLDIFAPGVQIYSLKPGNAYDTGDGTSAATPFVSGVAGLMLAQNPQLKHTEIWWRLYQSTDDFPAATNSAPVIANLPELTSAPAAGQFRIYLPGVARLRSTPGRLNALKAIELPITSATSAAADTCSSEPSNCGPGCGAEVALAGSASGLHELQALRMLRDQQMATTASGRRWIAIYEAHRLELASLLVNDADLRAQARSSLALWSPLIQALIARDASQPTTLDAAQVAEARALLRSIQGRASSEFQADLNAVDQILDLADTYIGRDVHLFWQAFLGLEAV